MFKNEYKDSFGKTYSSGVYEAAQKANNWSLAYTLAYALSKNGMQYATDKTGKCSVINETSLAPTCTIAGKSTDTTCSVIAKFKSMSLIITILTSSDGKYAFPRGIFVVNSDGETLGTLCKYDEESTSTSLSDSTIPLYGPKCQWIYEWSNDINTDEDKYRVQTATFKDADANFDCCSLHFWAEDVSLGAIMFFKAKDYFSSKYKYGFGMFKHNSNVVYKFADGTDCAIHSVFEGAGRFPTKIAKTCYLVSPSFSGTVGGTNGLYQITDGDEVLSLFPENKVSINGRDFQAVAPGIFARTS